MKKIIFFFCILSFVSQAQRVIPFTDFNGYFRSFENDNFRQIEFQEIQQYKAGDELVAANNLRIKTSLDEVLKNIDLSNSVNITFSRAGLIKICALQCVKNTKANYKIVSKNNDNPFFLKWLIK